MPQNMLAAFRGPNSAAIDEAAYSNALLENQRNRIPQANRMQDQQIQAQDLEISQAQRENAAGILGRNFSLAAQSRSPRDAARALIASPDFQTAGKLVGLPVEQFTVTDQDDDATIRQQLEVWAQALTGGVSRLENPDIPSAVRVAEYYAGLPAEGQGVTRPIFNEANRAPTIREIGGVQTQVGPGNAVNPLGSLPAEEEARRRLAQAQASGTATGGAQGQAAAGLPDALADIEKFRRDIQGFTSSPGFSTVYGKSRPLAFIPGSDGANAEGRRRTLDAQAFGVTIQKMRGLGSLSEAEGKKVSDAFTYATNPNISEEEARVAWDEVLRTLELAELRARQKAGGGAAPVQSQSLDFSQMTDEQLLQIINGQ